MLCGYACMYGGIMHSEIRRIISGMYTRLIKKCVVTSTFPRTPEPKDCQQWVHDLVEASGGPVPYGIHRSHSFSFYL